ncbi:MAG: DUF4405 domain-containing protein [Desulfobacterales bacterium]|nr:DUF4405 domain-containing protein [Desulfobacterales bacterium]
MLKKTTSLTLALSGLVMLVTSIVLYFSPAGQVGHFCPWSFWHLSRHHWGALHLNSGLLFCLAMIVHVWLNFRLLAAYVKRQKKGRPAIAVSLILTLYVCVGGYFELSPMGEFLDFARSFKMASIQKYGSPPYGTAARYPALHIARYMGWDPQKSREQLSQNSIILAAPDQSLWDLAQKNHTSIGRLLDIMCTHGDKGDLK